MFNNHNVTVSQLSTRHQLSGNVELKKTATIRPRTDQRQKKVLDAEIARVFEPI